MESEQILKWCDEKGIDVRKAIVLSEVSVEVTDDVIYKELDGAKIFGHCKIVLVLLRPKESFMNQKTSRPSYCHRSCSTHQPRREYKPSECYLLIS